MVCRLRATACETAASLGLMPLAAPNWRDSSESSSTCSAAWRAPRLASGWPDAEAPALAEQIAAATSSTRASVMVSSPTTAAAPGCWAQPASRAAVAAMTDTFTMRARATTSIPLPQLVLRSRTESTTSRAQVSNASSRMGVPPTTAVDGRGTRTVPRLAFTRLRG